MSLKVPVMKLYPAHNIYWTFIKDMFDNLTALTENLLIPGDEMFVCESAMEESKSTWNHLLPSAFRNMFMCS